MPIQDYVVTIVFDRHLLVTIYINQLEHSEKSMVSEKYDLNSWWHNSYCSY